MDGLPGHSGSERPEAPWGIGVLFFASGAAALIFEMAWLRLFVNVFGNTTYSTSAVLAAFMGGLALGGFIFGRKAEGDVDPWVLFGTLEVGAAVGGLAVPFVTLALTPVYRAIFNAAPDSMWLLTSAKFLLGGATMLVPATLLGGTLPALVKVVCPVGDGDDASPPSPPPPPPGGRIASLYAINTAGAVAGVFAGGLLLVPALGLLGTTLVASGISGAVGVLVLSGALGRYDDEPPPATPELVRLRRAALMPDAPSESKGPGGAVILAAGAACGFASLGCEVVWTRLLVFVLESTVYALTIMLGTFLAGMALGGEIARRLLRPGWQRGAHGVRPDVLLAVSVAGAGAAVTGSAVLFSLYPGIAGDVQKLVGMDWQRATLQRFALSGAVMAPAAVCFGAAFPAGAAAYAARSGGLARPVGAFAAANTVGAVAGSLAAGLVLAGHLGSQSSLVALGAMLLITAGTLGWCDGRLRARWRHAALLGAVTAAVAAMLFVPTRWGLDEFFNVNEPASALLHAEEGVGGVVAVHHYGDRGLRLISTNGVNVAGTAYELRATQRLQAALPLVLHGSAKSVLQVGYGSGETSRVLVAAGVRRVSVVEINPQIIPVAARYFGVINGNVEKHERFRPIIMDGANLVRLTRERFDLIMNDSIWPHLPGCSGLYTREYFAEARERLEPGGIMTSWLPLELNERAFATVLATFLSAYPHSTLWSLSADATKHALLVGTAEPLSLDPDEVASRVKRFGLESELAAVGIDSTEKLLASLLVGEEGLRKLAGGARPNSRSRPVLEFMTSRRRSRDARTRMAANLEKIDDVLASASTVCRGIGPEFGARLDYLASERRRRVKVRARRLVESAKAAPVGERGDEALNSGDVPEAISIYRDAARIAPRDGKVQLRLARALAQDGRLREALHHYKLATELRPNEPDGWLYYGMLAKTTGSPDEARRAFARVLELDPWGERKIRQIMPEMLKDIPEAKD